MLGVLFRASRRPRESHRNNDLQMISTSTVVRNIHLVHVGKCAGESIHSAFRQHDIPWNDYHVGQSNVAIANRVLAQDKNDYFVILLRDPISRFVSAFEWDLFEKIIVPDVPPRPEAWGLVYNTFLNANSLAEALTSPDFSLRGVAELAMRASALHMQMDLGWYLPPHIAALLHKGNAFAVRIEHINDDFARLLDDLGVPIKPGFAVPFSKNNYKSRIPENRKTDTLSETAVRNVKFYSLSSYETISILKKKGILPAVYI